MSWDVVLFNSKQKIESIDKLDENQLVPTDFCGIIENSFKNSNKVDNYIEIIGNDFSIDFTFLNELVSNIMLSLNGENGLFELIELAKINNWQIYDSALGEMIDLENPEKNGYKNHKSYVEKILKLRNE